MVTNTEQDYLKTIFELQQKSPAATTEIAAKLNLTPSSVTKMLKKLEESGFVDYLPHHGAKLTKSGDAQARAIIRKSRIVETFLVNCLKYSWEEVRDEACILEHSISHKMEIALYEFLGKPERDPHGDPIFDPNEMSWKDIDDGVQLTDAIEGKQYIITRIRHEDPEALIYLKEIGTLPNTLIKVKIKNQIAGIISFFINENEVTLGLKLSEKIFVKEATKNDN